MLRLIYLLLLLFSGNAFASDIVGTVVFIVDGDTFDIRYSGRTERIRFCGIDTPERGENNYKEASDTLRGLIKNKKVRCTRIGEGTPCDSRSRKTNRGRVIAQCFLGNADIATIMVRRGYACDYPKYSDGYYRRVGGSNVCIRK